MLVLLIGLSRPDLLIVLVALSILHFFIDFGKNAYAKKYPAQIILPYLVDQGVHLLSIIVFAWLIDTYYPGAAPWMSESMMLIAIALVSVTYVWGITERILVHKDRAYVSELHQQFYSRMIARVLFLGSFLILIVRWSGVQIAPLLVVPYVHSIFWRRALFTDICVSIATAGILLQLF